MAFKAEQGPPERTQEQFFDAMEEWAKKHMQPHYERDTIEEKIKLLWRTLWPKR